MNKQNLKDSIQTVLLFFIWAGVTTVILFFLIKGVTPIIKFLLT